MEIIGGFTALAEQNWKREIEERSSDLLRAIRYTQLSAVDGYGFYVSIVPPGGANTGHWHPQEPEKYHIAKGHGLMLSQPVEQIGKTSPSRQPVEEGMSVHIPGRVVHRIVNTGKEPLIFFFECIVAHMRTDNPETTIIKDFGGTVEQILRG